MPRLGIAATVKRRCCIVRYIAQADLLELFVELGGGQGFVEKMSLHCRAAGIDGVNGWPFDFHAFGNAEVIHRNPYARVIYAVQGLRRQVDRHPFGIVPGAQLLAHRADRKEQLQNKRNML